MYHLFHHGEAAPSIRNLKLPKDSEEWGSKGNEGDYLFKLRRLLAKMGPDDQKLLLHMAQKVARR
jgi:cation transport regulator ChaC